MYSLLGTIQRRSFHTGLVKFQFVKDVYKTIGYEAPFPEVSKTQVLDQLNIMNEEELYKVTTKKFSKMIVIHREKNGLFECVEQLLDIPKVETLAIEKIVNQFLKNETKVTKSEEENKSKKLKIFFSKDIIPKPNLNLFFGLENPTIVGLNVTLNGISFAKIDINQTLYDWNILESVGNPSSQLPYQHHKLVNSSSDLLTRIPEGDYYVMEEMLSVLPKDPYVKHKVNLVKMRTALQTLISIQRRNSLGDPVQVHTIKPNVPDVLFKLKIGTERVSIQENLHRLLGPSISNDNPFQTSISDEAWESWRMGNNQSREMISSALLKALAFNYLCGAAYKNYV